MLNNRRKSAPVKFGASSPENGSNSRRLKMNSKRLETITKEVSWSNIQDQLAALLYAMKVVPESREITSIKLDYAGGYVAQDKAIKMEIITKKGVDTIKF